MTLYVIYNYKNREYQLSERDELLHAMKSTFTLELTEEQAKQKFGKMNIHEFIAFGGCSYQYSFNDECVDVAICLDSEEGEGINVLGDEEGIFSDIADYVEQNEI